MTLYQAIILGFVQGITEFLPISSSGHLVLLPKLLAWNISPQQAFTFDVFLQAATLLAVISFFYNDFRIIFKAIIAGFQNHSLSNSDAKLGFYLILSTIPAGTVGFVLNGYFEKFFSDPYTTSILLIINSFILMIAERVGKNTRNYSEVNWVDSMWIGIFQIFALFPGISRSGITITGGMLRGLDRQSSARYSFLISVPLLIAAGINGLQQFISLPNTTTMLPNLIAGSIVAALVGYLSIKWLLSFLANKSLSYFAVYCFIFGIINLIVILLTNL